MAIISPTRRPQADADSDDAFAAEAAVLARGGSSSPGRFRAAATQWLGHPLSSVYLVAVSSALLLALGTVMVWSASSVYAYTHFKDSYTFVKRQAIFLILGAVGVVIAARFPLRRLKSLGWVIYGVSGILLCLTLILGISVKGNMNWISIGPSSLMLRFQPSELAKLAIILWGAAVFSAKRKLLDQPKHLLIPFLPGSLLLTGLVVLQHDVGTAVIMGALIVAMLWCVGASWRVLGTIFSLVGLAAAALVITSPNRLARIFAFLDPTMDAMGSNYQPNQAQFGMATGGWWGVGLGASRQKWGSLSEAHTDYVLAIVGEELGVIGTLGVMALLLILGYAGFRIALRSDNLYWRMVSAGITCWLMIQALVNVLVVLRLLPVLGVPLPLVSYGGSSLAVTMVAIGILICGARDEPQARAFLEREKQNKKPRGRLSAVLPGRRRG